MEFTLKKTNRKHYHWCSIKVSVDKSFLSRMLWVKYGTIKYGHQADDNITSGINTDIKMNWQKLETVTSFKYLGSIITDESSKPEILSRTAQKTAVYRGISLRSKIQLMLSLVSSIFLYACESWTPTAELQRRIQAVEKRCYRKILRISYKDHATNEEARAKIQQVIGPHEDLLTIVKRRKLQWYGHVSRSSGPAKTILQGTVKGGRRQGGQRKRWEDSIRERTGLEFTKSERAVENREKWRKLVAKSSVVPQRPSQVKDRWGWMHWTQNRTQPKPQMMWEKRLKACSY